jgi:ankyrin repeat protein
MAAEFDDRLVEAVIRQDRAAARAAILAGADPALKVDRCVPVLFLAAARGDLAMVRELVQLGADLDAQDHNDDTVLTYLASLPLTPRHEHVAKYLLEAGVDPCRARNSNFPLGNAITYRNLGLARLLFGAGAREHGAMEDHPEYIKLIQASRTTGRS